MHSFVTTLIKACRIIRPKKIIEWGPGLSTSIMHRECPDAEIITVEHDKDYFAKACAEHSGYASVRFIPANGQRSVYACFLLEPGRKYGPFDLAFVDGRRRVECALTAWRVLSYGGMLLVHDWQRWQYKILAHYLGDCYEPFSDDTMTGVWVR